jgi:hypothetical protein
MSDKRIEIMELIKIDFDGLENHCSNAIMTKTLGLFVADDGLSAHGKCREFIATLAPEKRYLGWDGNIYPKYKTRTRIANSL